MLETDPGTVFLNVNWNFKAPVRPGDSITGEVKVTHVREDKPICEFAAAGSISANGTNSAKSTIPYDFHFNETRISFELEN